VAGSGKGQYFLIWVGVWVAEPHFFRAFLGKGFRAIWHPSVSASTSVYGGGNPAESRLCGVFVLAVIL
jgi:hypothetical protein